MAETVQLEVGQIVDITLESMMGSTGYGWELTELESGMGLMAIQMNPTGSHVVAPVAQIFHFRALKPGTAKASFVLTAPWKVEEPFKRVSYEFRVVPAEVQGHEKLKQTLKMENFVAPPSAQVYAEESDPAARSMVCDPRSYMPPAPAEPRMVQAIPPVPDEGTQPPLALKYGMLPRMHAGRPSMAAAYG